MPSLPRGHLLIPYSPRLVFRNRLSMRGLKIRADPRRSEANLLFGGFRLGVFSAESLHAAGGIHKLLFAGKEWMAIRADFYVDVALVRRASGKAVAAGAHDADFVISGMNSWFHVCFGPQCESLDSKRRAQDSANSRGASVVEKHSAFIDVAPHARSLAPPEKRRCSG